MAPEVRQPQAVSLAHFHMFAVGFKVNFGDPEMSIHGQTYANEDSQAGKQFVSGSEAGSGE